MDVDVVDERPYPVIRGDGVQCWIYNFGLRLDASVSAQRAGHDVEDVQRRFCDAFVAAWRGACEVDRCNVLVLCAGGHSRCAKRRPQLLFTGGIGTYVKASAETHADVADKADDVVRVDGAQVRVRVVAEGGDLGLTQRGRIARSPPRCWSTKSSTTVASPTPTGWPKSSRSRLPTRVRAYSVAVAVFDLHATWQAIADLSNPVPMSVADDMMLALRRLAVLRVIGVLGHRSDVGPRERAGTRRPLARVGSPGTAR